MLDIKNIRVGKRLLFTGDSFSINKGSLKIEYFLNVDQSFGDFSYDDLYIVKRKINPSRDYYKKAFDIKYMSDEAINGFYLLIDGNDDFAYVREEDRLVIPKRFDIATPFNEYGYAMIADKGSVTWINKNFENFNPDTNTFVDPSKGNFVAFREVHEFNGLNNPLSKAVEFDDTVSYVNTNGKLQGFRYILNDGSISSWDKELFDDLEFTNFDNRGIMIPPKRDIALVEDGYIYSKDKVDEIDKKQVKNKIIVKK